ncbi:hypothetical protein [Desulfovibrio sp. UCD-KL4C]|nr:hypothetical protein [Desulfovibrio sp. UCD-KL4C]
MLTQHWMMMVMGIMALFGGIGVLGMIFKKKKSGDRQAEACSCIKFTR